MLVDALSRVSSQLHRNLPVNVDAARRGAQISCKTRVRLTRLIQGIFTPRGTEKAGYLAQRL
ncbi:hypothetical protein M413DRAFT_448639 [Hebeloma cylindrosporum]|uniref:Uncharacterized protein n=1 Tax=Hebeloma cylindrosporum TaxID=76867 RepID=A0A0C2Y8K9_HEBCY|nr:hypothetical protein M413DRAFT_448639 [Hebeloma cylindrosporum h7]